MSDITKLPKWGQTLIRNLQNQNESLKSRIRSFERSAPTRICSGPYEDHPIYLPDTKWDTVRFAGMDGSWIDIRMEGDTLRVMSDSYLTISPQSSNVIVMSASREKAVR